MIAATVTAIRVRSLGMCPPGLVLWGQRSASAARGFLRVRLQALCCVPGLARLLIGDVRYYDTRIGSEYREVRAQRAYQREAGVSYTLMHVVHDVPVIT
ncbi:MAG: hypothetical protein KJP23_26620 [Deltaproteobacteria bacterium]|nr:hypothetical protein [Deltaproteobacteria bacterium]